jgi:hypothetical protein
MSTATEPRPATLEELKARHAKTPAQVAALRAADQHLFEKHPGEYVAYTDEWSGDTLERSARFTRRSRPCRPKCERARR